MHSEEEKFDRLSIGLASPDKMREWSKGEVKKPETINYRTLKPERDGLFCEKIFGPTKDWECYCGKYKKVRYKGIICDRCGVEVTKKSVRRERMGHVELATPVSHIWYFKGIPSRMSLILDVSPKALERVIYFASYIVTDAKETGLTYKQVINEKEYREAIEKYGYGSFEVGMGAEAVKKLLEQVDLEKLEKEIRASLEKATGQKRPKLIKRLELSKEAALEMFKNDPYKIDIIENLADDEIISAYKQEEFVDLCRGPHVKSTKLLKNFKLLKHSGAYYKGDSNIKMLQRIYGICFEKEEELQAHLDWIEEAKKRDHRRLGKDLELFMISEYGPGFPFFLPNGMILRKQLEDFWYEEHRKEGYEFDILYNCIY